MSSLEGCCRFKLGLVTCVKDSMLGFADTHFAPFLWGAFVSFWTHSNCAFRCLSTQNNVGALEGQKAFPGAFHRLQRRTKIRLKFSNKHLSISLFQITKICSCFRFFVLICNENQNRFMLHVFFTHLRFQGFVIFLIDYTALLLDFQYKIFDQFFNWNYLFCEVSNGDFVLE
jgi:hypothetical protein